jgi:hypothetical protein
MSATLRIPRSRGALSGLLLVLLGIWGALVPLVGPYFHFGFAPDKAWHLTSGRIWLEVAPGAAVFLGGLIALVSANRAFAGLGAWVAALGGAWFVLGVPLSALWAKQGHIQLGQALGGTSRQVTEQLSTLYGLGVVAVFLAAVALGRLAVIGVKDAALAETETPYVEETEPDAAPATDTGPRPRAPWAEPVSATRTQPMLKASTVGESDVKVAGETTRETRRPGANA